MAKIWYAGPKKGRSNFINLVRVSGEGYWADLLCLMLPMFVAFAAEDRIFPNASLMLELLFLVLTFLSAHMLVKLIVVHAFRKHIDFDNPHTSYRDGVFVADAERV